MKKVLFTFALAPLIFAADLSHADPAAMPIPAAPIANEVQTSDSATNIAQWRRNPRRGAYRRYRYCRGYRRNCTRIVTPIGRVVIGNCRNVCNRWGWRNGWFNAAETQSESARLFMIPTTAATEPMASTLATDFSQRYAVDYDTAEMLVKSFAAAEQGHIEGLARLGLEADDYAAIKSGARPSAESVERLSQALEVEPQTAEAMIRSL